VRFDMESDKTAEIAISIAPEQRGCGYGVEAVRLACDYLRRQRPVTRIVAYIKPHNNASQGTFKKAGFLFQGQKKVKENEAVVMTLEVDST
jgi:RimJ/RimL family protein N-acetyltransferase